MIQYIKTIIIPLTLKNDMGVLYISLHNSSEAISTIPYDTVTKLFPWFKASFFRILKQALVFFRSYQSTPEPIICSEYATFNCVGVLTAPGLGQSMF